ncbi:ABC transporter permease [Alteriqipengyuania sp. WL0013]|uniref:ABC transporter permease n=1 Tax=Alteriqipengyuania sp. WL0013 TaxID=3110773 RepID=UPI003A5D1184
MTDQAQSLASEAPVLRQDSGTSAGKFPPPGEARFHGMNRVGLWTLYVKEVRRFLKVQTQTVWAPAITTLLFLVIFTVALGRSGREVLGVPFGSFVAPGLIMMGMMQNAFANSSFGLLVGKIQGTIVDYLMPPIASWELMLAIVAAAITRAVMVGAAVALAMWLYPGVTLSAEHPWAIAWFGLMGAMLLALVGLITSIWAEKFDHNAAITNFVIAPLTLLSGTFYVIDNLAPTFQTISRLNPFFYVISGFRYGFLGETDIASTDAAVWHAALGVLALNIVVAVITYRLLKSGWKLKS